MRKLRIDELPQLWNVLIGEMSLIGPRPERPQFDEILEAEIPHYKKRLAIRPKVSGWAQVNYPYGSSIQDSYKKLSFDLYYLKNFSFLLDFLILIKTIRIVFTAKGAIPKMTNKKVALITGITGQDGSYLAEFLLEKKTMKYMASKEDLAA